MNKAIKLLLLLLLFGNYVSSQTIGQAEYFFDTDPGVGNGTQITMTSTGDSANATITISSSALSTGFHKLYVRVKNSSGMWSLHDEELIYVYSTTPTTITPPSQPLITKAEYFFDTDPGIGNGTAITGITTGDSIDVTKTISTSSLSTGYHRLYVRVRNSGGTWSLHDEELFYIYPTTATTTQPQAAQVSKVEYFIGTIDPGTGNGTAINATVAGDSITINDSLNVTSLSAGTYKITFRAKDAAGKWGFSTTKEFTVLACTLPTVNFTASDVCIGDSVAFTNTSSNLNSPAYSWDILNDGTIDKTVSGSFKHYFSSASTYQVKLKVTNQSLCSDSVVKTIIVRELPIANAAAVGNTSFCDGLSVMLSGNTGQSFGYQWLKDNTEVLGATNIYYTATQGGNYKFKLTDGYGCKNFSNSIAVTVNPNPTATITPATTTSFCQGDSLQFNANAGAGLIYQWKLNGINIPNGNAQSIWINQSGVLSLQVTTTSGCTNTSSNTQVSMNFPPFASIFALGSTTFCQGDSVKLGTTSGYGYTHQWYKDGVVLANDTNQQLTVKTSGQYKVTTSTAAGCSSTSSVQNILVNPIYTANFTMDSAVCALDTVTLTYVGNGNSTAYYQWNYGQANFISGAGQGPLKISYTNAGNQTVSLTVSDNGCSSPVFSDSVYVQSFNANITSFTQSVCQGDSITLYANVGSNYLYQWYHQGLLIAGANAAQYNANISGSFQVQVNDSVTGCSSTTPPIVITVNTSDFNLAFSANTTNFNQPPFNVSFINQTPNMGNYNFFWELGDGNISNFFNPMHSYQYNGNYTVTLYAENSSTGCRDTLTQNNFISCAGGIPNPCQVVAAITTGGSSTICGGDSVLLTASSGTGYTYQWVHNNMLVIGATGNTFWAKQAGSYRVVVSDNLCSQTSSAFVLLHYPSIQPVIHATGIIQPCTTDSMKLSLLVNYNDYQWSTGDTTASIYVSQTGYYQVSVSDNFGCNLTSQPYVVNSSFLNPPEICIVGVDSLNHNRIVWERVSNALIDSFYVYRESFIAGQYNKIGAIPFTTTSMFVDSNSNPAVQSYRYKIAAVDTCGGLTLLSMYHKTIHLTINAGLNGSWNLIWDGYYGFPFSTYRIYRGSNSATMSLLTQLPSTATSYTDLNPPSGTVFYQIEVIKNNGCYPDTMLSKANTNYNTSRSNTANNTSIAPIYFAAEFSANALTGQWPILVEFTDQTTGSPNKWRWDFGDGNSSIEQHPMHTYNNTGLYSVTLIACNGNVCDTMNKINLINVLQNGQVEIGVSMNARLYPNPNDGSFTLELYSAKPENAKLYIYNSIGQMVMEEDLEVNGQYSKQIKLHVNASGVYYVHLSTKTGIIFREKVIIK